MNMMALFHSVIGITVTHIVANYLSLLLLHIQACIQEEICYVHKQYGMTTYSLIYNTGSPTQYVIPFFKVHM